MTAAIIGFLTSTIGPYLIGGAVAVIAVIGALMKGRIDGAKLERAKQAAKDRHAIDEAQAIDDAIAGRSAQANRDALKRWGPK